MFVDLAYWKLYCHSFRRMGRHIISGDTLRLFMSAARLWTAFAKTRCAQTLARCRTSAALITKCLLSSLQNDMPPLRRYIGQKFPYAIRLLDNGRWISSENMKRRMISTILYLHIKWKYVANRLIIFSCKHFTTYLQTLI